MNELNLTSHLAKIVKQKPQELTAGKIYTIGTLAHCHNLPSSSVTKKIIIEMELGGLTFNQAYAAVENRLSNFYNLTEELLIEAQYHSTPVKRGSFRFASKHLGFSADEHKNELALLAKVEPILSYLKNLPDTLQMLVDENKAFSAKVKSVAKGEAKF